MMLTEAEWRNIDEFRRHWHDFCDCDAFEGCDTFADRMESSGFIELVPVDADAVESSFAEERGIVPGGMMWTLIPAGRAALDAKEDRC